MDCHLDWIETVLFIASLLVIGGVGFSVGVAYSQREINRWYSQAMKLKRDLSDLEHDFEAAMKEINQESYINIWEV